MQLLLARARADLQIWRKKTPTTNYESLLSTKQNNAAAKDTSVWRPRKILKLDSARVRA